MSQINLVLDTELRGFNHKIIVLDDDPTGTQTVHNVPVYTSWDKETIRQVFADQSNLVYILTNSRSFSQEKTEKVHLEIGKTIGEVSKECSKPFLLILRGDSTLRGHFPLETEALRVSLEQELSMKFDGEIICPAFFEGGRYTIGDVHYLKKDHQLIPVGETEFAQDKTFGYRSSNLRGYIQEKSNGVIKEGDCLSITNHQVEQIDINGMVEVLDQSKEFQKIIVNGQNYDDLSAFAVALLQTIKKGKNYLFRTAASFPKVIGGISDREYLTSAEIVDGTNENGGLIIIGSHVELTNKQLLDLQSSQPELEFIEFDVTAYNPSSLYKEQTAKIQADVNHSLKCGKTVVVYTSRKLLTTSEENKELALAASVAVSSALTQIVADLPLKPKYIIAKGGITSSDVATIGLGIKRALVLGQVVAGIPIWLTDEGSKFANTPYLIFPGNVGSTHTLSEIVEKLEKEIICEK